MEKILLKADERTEKGKGAARSLRRAGQLPAVVYGAGKSIPIKLNRKEMVSLLKAGIAEHALITLELNRDKAKSTEHPVLIKEYQVDPIDSILLHVDFIEISLKDKLKLSVAIIITREPKGIKEGGILELQMREVEIECLPTNIPHGIEVDAEFIEIGHSLHVSDLIPMEGIKIISDPGQVILVVSSPKMEAAAAPAEGEVKEPEVLKAKGKAAEGESKETKK
ncbi:MAG: 50S ribosomal protein L25 [Thermodesulfovibrionia bacterium]|nr:50S ribosomal protein L25 [Thermodesulfovibrionia bacterium]